MKLVALILLMSCGGAALAQQRQPVFADPTGRPASSPPVSPAPASQRPARFADPNPERLTADQQHCRNLEAEIVRAEQQARDANTTGAQDQFAAKRERLIEQRGKAGC